MKMIVILIEFYNQVTEKREVKERVIPETNFLEDIALEAFSNDSRDKPLHSDWTIASVARKDTGQIFFNPYFRGNS